MDRETLLNAARKAALHAYAPYSHFRVGAAVVVETPGGEERIVTGANIENGSFGLTLCAERTALAAAYMLEGKPEVAGMPPVEERATMPRQVYNRPHVKQVAVACIDVPGDAPAWKRSPCGACKATTSRRSPGIRSCLAGSLACGS